MRVLAQNFFTHPDPKPGAAQQRPFSSMTKDYAVLADILCEEKLAVGPFNEVQLVEIGRDVPPGGRKNCGFTGVAAKLKTQTRVVCQTRHLQGANDPAAL